MAQSVNASRERINNSLTRIDQDQCTDQNVGMNPRTDLQETRQPGFTPTKLNFVTLYLMLIFLFKLATIIIWSFNDRHWLKFTYEHYFRYAPSNYAPSNDSPSVAPENFVFVDIGLAVLIIILSAFTLYCLIEQPYSWTVQYRTAIQVIWFILIIILHAVMAYLKIDQLRYIWLFFYYSFLYTNPYAYPYLFFFPQTPQTRLMAGLYVTLTVLECLAAVVMCLCFYFTVINTKKLNQERAGGMEGGEEKRVMEREDGEREVVERVEREVERLSERRVQSLVEVAGNRGGGND